MGKPNLAVLVGAQSLVERSRLGDQNARALIMRIAQSASRGGQRAKESIQAIQKYIKKNPVKDPRDSVIGSEGVDVLGALKGHVQANSHPAAMFPSLAMLPEQGKEAIRVACVILANGPLLTNQRISALGSALHDPECRRIFFMGIMFCGKDACQMARGLTPQGKPLINAGQVIGLAREIQKVRMPNSPVSAFSPDAGWELGE